MNVSIVPYTSDEELLWDDFVINCPMATFLHTRKFLAYHGSRFQDQSLLFFNEKNRLVGVLPAANKPNQEDIVLSHPGATFGGIVHRGKLIGSEIVEVFKGIINYYKKKGIKGLIYKAVPYIYHQSPVADDLYALFYLNAMLYRRDLSCTVDLLLPPPLSNKDHSKLRNCIRKSEKSGLSIKEGVEYLSQLWTILVANLEEKYNTMPVHSLEEMKNLISLFPGNVKVVVACIGDEVVAGTILFCHKIVMHTQYLVVTGDGAKIFALDAIIQYCIKQATEKGYRYFDFGMNNEREGRVLNHSLYLSKVKHGGGGVVYDFYKIVL